MGEQHRGAEDEMLNGEDAVKAREAIGRQIDKELFPGDTSIEKIFVDIKKMAEAQRQADAIMVEYAEKEPKFQELLGIPQSVDKHAEGPTIRDHMRCILTSLKMIEAGLLTSEQLRGSVDFGGKEKEWDGVLEFVRENPKLMLAFGVCHDFGKVDYFGAYGKSSEGVAAGFPAKKDWVDMLRKKSIKPEMRKNWREKYKKLYDEFGATRPVEERPEDTEKAFFEKYGISATYIEHERGPLVKENSETIDRVCEELGLGEKEKKLLVTAILYHVHDHLTFSKGPAELAGAEDYAGLHKFAEDADVDVEKEMKLMQAGMLIDGVLGARKRQEGVEGLSVGVDSLIKFLKAEQKYPEYLKIVKEKQREKAEREVLREVAIAAGLRGEHLLFIGFDKKKLGGLIEIINSAIVSGKDIERKDLPGVSPKNVKILNVRVMLANEEFAKKMSMWKAKQKLAK